MMRACARAAAPRAQYHDAQRMPRARLCARRVRHVAYNTGNASLCRHGNALLTRPYVHRRCPVYVTQLYARRGDVATSRRQRVIVRTAPVYAESRRMCQAECAEARRSTRRCCATRRCRRIRQHMAQANHVVAGCKLCCVAQASLLQYSRLCGTSRRRVKCRGASATRCAAGVALAMMAAARWRQCVTA